MSIKISKENQDIPKGFRKLNEKEIADDFLSLDNNGDYSISKNEWMMTFIKMLGKDMEALEKEGPDSIMQKIRELSAEFDYYDTDGSKYLDCEEYKNILINNVFISE